MVVYAECCFDVPSAGKRVLLGGLMCRTVVGRRGFLRVNFPADQGTGGSSRVQFGTKNAETGYTQGE